MGERIVEALVAILTAIIGIAIIAVLVGKGSQTADVLRQGGSSFANILRAAEGH